MHRNKFRYVSALTLLTVTLYFAAVATAPHVDLQAVHPPTTQEQQLQAGPETPTLLPESSPAVAERRRTKRAFGDFFAKLWTVGSLGKAQYDDTRSSLAKIYDILRDQFSDTATVKKTVCGEIKGSQMSSNEFSVSVPLKPPQSGAVGNGTSSTGEVTETTTERYRISRKELGRILNRNFRGLKRLAEIERREAQNATKYNIQEYKVQLANSLQSFVYKLPSN